MEHTYCDYTFEVQLFATALQPILTLAFNLFQVALDLCSEWPSS